MDYERESFGSFVKECWFDERDSFNEERFEIRKKAKVSDEEYACRMNSCFRLFVYYTLLIIGYSLITYFTGLISFVNATFLSAASLFIGLYIMHDSIEETYLEWAERAQYLKEKEG